MKNLDLIKKNLKKLKTDKTEYFIPALWKEKVDPEDGKINVDPFDFFLERIERIEEISKKIKIELPGKNWLDKAIVYNVFVRYLSAFDHDSDGKIDIDNKGLRETGTFLKLIAMLPYLHSLGINTLHLLPITAIGKDGKKGNLGSPYAIRDHYKLDENLAEDIPGLDVEIQFKAFVEACHSLGMKIVLEFVFRTASIDSDLALEHPRWFYWIREYIENRPDGSESESKYGNPIFTDEEMEKIKSKVESGDMEDLPEPHDKYKEIFTEVPKKVARVDDRIIGIYGNEKTARIPGAFADWPPDDTQPPWDDVTYLRMYDHKDYNYIAYNTVRMYEKNLAKKKYRVEDLWEYISGIVPHYIDNYDIDGVMVDMGHALPAPLMNSIITKARKKKEGFVFWEENFALTERSVEQGYDACIGYMPFDQHVSWKMKQILKMLEDKRNPIEFFATPESHNTPRAASRQGSVDYCRQTWLINRFMNQIPFMLGGFELGSAQPINTGLGFEKNELEMYPAEKLPLFSNAALPWQTKAEFTGTIKKINELREKYDFGEIDEKPLLLIETEENEIIAFLRKVRSEERYVLIVCNMQNEFRKNIELEIPFDFKNANDKLNELDLPVEGNKIITDLDPWQSVCAELR